MKRKSNRERMMRDGVIEERQQRWRSSEKGR